MLEGSLFSNLMKFSVPLMLTNVLQVLFNMSDVAVVGKFAGSAALGSVGSTTILVTLFVGIALGMGTGVNVITARHIGAGDEEGVKSCVTTSFVISLVEGVLLFLLAFLPARAVLELLGTKEELLDGAVRYLRIYAAGLPALAVYNFGAGVLDAKGDTKTPLFILSIAGLSNVGMNLIFVIVFQMAEAGVALASAISQTGSAVAICVVLLKSSGVAKLTLSSSLISKRLASRILALGLPAAFQNTVFALANLFIQSAVNSFDTVIVEGNAAAQNADGFTYDIMAAVYAGCAAFVSCNYGAGQTKRVIKSYYVSLAISSVAGIIIGSLFLIFAGPFLALFTNESAVIEAGRDRLIVMALSYWISAFMDNAIAASRGIGKAVAPTIIVIMGSCVFRVLWVLTIFAHFHTIISLYSLYAASWTLTAIAENIYFFAAWKRSVIDTISSNC